MSNQPNNTSVGDVGRAAGPAYPHHAASIMPAGSITRTIARDWKRIAAITIAVTAIAWSLAALQPARYRASALASVTPLADALQPNELLRSVEVLERRTVVATVAALASTPVTRARVVASGYDVRASILPNTNLFRVEVEGANAAQAAAIANRVPEILSTQTRALYKYYSVTMVSPAVAPSAPFLPRTGRAILAGLLIGLFLGLLAAFADQWRVARHAHAA